MSKFLRPALFVLFFMLLWSLFQPPKDQQSTDDVILYGPTEVPISKLVTLTVLNNSDQPLSLKNECPKNPLRVEKYVNGQWVLKEVQVEGLKCGAQAIVIKPKEALAINYSKWSPKLFDEKGRYRLNVDVTLKGAEKVFTKEIEVTSRSVFRVMWEEIFYKPLLNVLIFFLSFIPGHHLGWAVILLTLLIKFILLAPNQKALRAQRRMQKIQPQLEALKKKYQNEPQRLAMETMEVWKKHKVSPMSSCLPLLIQFPVLIALFYVVKNGLTYINPQLLYAGLQGFDASVINPYFLGLDLTQINFIILPLVIGGLQYIQMKMSMGNALKNQPVAKDEAPNPMLMMNKTMIYFLPVMIALFTATVPAAVALYWGTSTVFGIVQQYFVNRAKD